MHFSLKGKVIASAVLSVGLLTTLLPASAFAVTAAEKQAEIRSVSATLSSLNEELSLAVDNYNIANRNHDRAVEAADECQNRINDATAKIESLQTRIGTRASSMYRSGSMSYLDVLMGVGSFDDFATVWDTLNELNSEDTQLTASVKEAKKELDAAKVELDQNRAVAAEELQNAEARKQDIESMTARYESIYNGLSAEYQELLAQEQAAAYRAAAAASSAYFPAVSSGGGGGDNGGGGDGGGFSVNYGDGSYSGDSDAVARAYAALGTPYVYGASSSSAFDCSGLVSYAITGSYGHAYVSQDFWAMSSVSDPQPGDVVACSPGHCGVYIGNGQMIEAPYTGASVTVSNVRGKVVRP